MQSEISLAFDADGYSQTFTAPAIARGPEAIVAIPAFDFVVRRYRQGYILQTLNGSALTSPLSHSGALCATSSLISRKESE